MLSRFFIYRPIFASVLSILIVVLGVVAYFALPVSEYPELAPPVVHVEASYPGANAQTIADTVALNAGAGTIYLQHWPDRPGRGTVLVKNNNVANTGPTEVPPYTNYISGEAQFATFRMSNAGKLTLLNDFTVGDIWLDTANARLDLGGKTLTVRSREHELGPGTVLNYGQIIWLPDIPKGTIYFAK